MKQLKEKDIEQLRKYVRTLQAQVNGINENYSFYHELNQKKASFERILAFVELKRTSRSTS